MEPNNPPVPNPNPAPNPAPAPTSWYNDFKDENVKNWLTSYGDAYQTPEALALKAYNLEKFMGAEKAGRGVVLPKADATPEEWQNFYRKVGGVPEKADGYKIPEAFVADPLIGGFRDAMHKVGMPPMLFDATMNWYSEAMKTAQTDEQAKFEQKAEAEWRELEQEWQGRDPSGAPMYDKKVELGRRAMNQFVDAENPKIKEELLNRMEAALGPKTMMKMWASIGEAMGEHKFEMGEGGSGGVTSVQAARARIGELQKDVAFAAKLASGDVTAKAEWDQLHKTAYPS